MTSLQDRTEDGRPFRMLTVIDEYSRRCLAIVVARKLGSDHVLHCLTELFVAREPPEHMRSDNGPEFVARNVREWLGRVGVETLFIEPAARGRMATARASTPSCATSCSQMSSSRRCTMPRC
jgi:putative transposase